MLPEPPDSSSPELDLGTATIKAHVSGLIYLMIDSPDEDPSGGMYRLSPLLQWCKTCEELDQLPNDVELSPRIMLDAYEAALTSIGETNPAGFDCQQFHPRYRHSYATTGVALHRLGKGISSAMNLFGRGQSGPLKDDAKVVAALTKANRQDLLDNPRSQITNMLLMADKYVDFWERNLVFDVPRDLQRERPSF